MNTLRRLRLKTLLSAICAVCLCCTMFLLVFGDNKTANANTSVSGFATSVGEIYDYDKVCYSEEALNELAAQILGYGKTIKDLVSAADRAGVNGTPIEDSRYITVSYGRYGSTLDQKNTSPKALSWIPVYLSKSNSGDAILTLYLDATYQQSSAYSRMEQYTFTSNGTYSTTASERAPSSSYGTSYMRAFVLGNGGTYYTYKANNAGGTASEAIINESDANKFADFVQVVDSNSNKINGVFYDDIVTPSEIKWQETESYAQYIGQWDGSDQYFPNEAYGTPSKGTGVNNATLGYANRINYSNWKNDKVWLPSITEVGTGDITNTADTTNGIWKLTADERANLGGISWLRTAYTAGTNPNPYTMFCTTANGQGYTTGTVGNTYSVRPAIHLNLTKISGKTVPPLNIPDTITVTYNGKTHNTASIANYDWYDASAIDSINFFSDAAGLHVTTPIDAGEYYIEIELNSLSSRYFINEDKYVRSKIFKFVIEKAKLAVQWTYGEDPNLNSAGGIVPVGVKVVETTASGLGQIYEWDVSKEKVPTVGIKYYSQASGGPQGITDYPDVKGQYTAKPYIIGEDEYSFNYEISEEVCKLVSQELEPDVIDSERKITYESWIFLVSERRIPIPEFSNGTDSLMLTYRGRQEVQIYNVTKYITITVDSIYEYEAMKPDYVNGIQTFWVESVGDYTFTATINDKDNIVWLGEEGEYTKTENKTLRVGIDKAHITVLLTGLLPSWESSRSVDVTLNLLGLYSDESDVNIEVIIRGSNTSEIKLPITNSKVTIPSGLPVDTYNFVVRMTGTNPYYNMAEQVSQSFKIVTSPASFTDDNVVWQYTTGSSTSNNPVSGDHSTEENAFEVPYTGNYYQFVLTMSETRLTQAGVRATYSGDTRVTDGGSYCVVVTISAYDKNVTFETKSYYFYFTITKIKYNLSGVEWDYASPFTYSGDEYSVTLKAGTLPAGLSVTYSTNGLLTNTETNVGSYSTLAIFKVLPEYENNYIVPDAEIATSYTGTFNFVLNWQITQKIINVSWKTDDGSSSLFFVPVLETGSSLVDYTYEIFNNGSWEEVDEVVSPDTGTSRYRVTAELKAIYTANYYLYAENDDYSYEFSVDSGKQAITVHIEVNDVKCDDGQQFTYTGNAFEAKPVVDAGNLAVGNYTVTYYNINANGTKGSALSSAPVNVGRYAAVIAITYESATSYLTEESETEVTFEITKADVDVTNLVWQYIHDSTVIVAHFNVNQGKWLDNDLNDVLFEFEYDGSEHKIDLIGAINGLTWAVTGNAHIDAGEYTAYIEFTPDANHNAPANFPVTLGWEITKAKVHLDNLQWGYIDQYGVEKQFDFNNGTLPYARNEFGDIPYTVCLINVPAEIKDFFVYTTHFYNDDQDYPGSSFSQIGVYRTSYTISIPANYSPNANYEPFTASAMPSFVSTSQIWEISEVELERPSYTGGWDTFDNDTHNLLDYCGMPEDQLYFFSIEVTFTDTVGRIYRDYAGYEDEQYVGFHAGKYIVTFYRIVGDDDKVYWGAVEIDVDKALLTVTWDRNGTIPVARVDGVYISDMLETVYTNGSGEEKTVAYIQTTDGVTFYAEPRITSDYAHNIGFVMKAGEVERYVFTSTKFTPDQQTQYLPMPTILNPQLEWTGNPITFAVSSWMNYYSGYLYVSDGSLTQTSVGKYKVTLSFEKDANACWEGTEGNRDSITLEFEIIMPTVVPLDKPVLQFNSIVYTGVATQFTIVNWVTYQSYLRIAEGSDNLTQTQPGTYHVTLEFFEGSTGCWNDGTRDPITLYFTIIPKQAQLSKPSLVFTWTYYTGSEITFVINNWSDYSDYLTYTGDSLTQTQVGEYSITFSFKSGINASWDSGDKNSFTLNFEIREISEEDKYPVTDNTVKLAKPTMVNAKQQYTGSSITFIIANWDTLSQYLEFTSDSASLTQSAVGTYVVTLKFKSGVDACWLDETQSEYRLIFSIEREDGSEPPEIPDDAVLVTKPYLVSDKEDYTGASISFEIFNWSYYANFLYIKSGSLTQVDARTYTIIVAFLSDKPEYYWEDTRDRSDFTLTFSIVYIPDGAKELAAPVLDKTSMEFSGASLIFTISNWSEISQYVTVDKILYADKDGNLGTTAAGAVSGGNISIDVTQLDGRIQVGYYAVTVRIKNKDAAVWATGNTDDYVLYFEVTRAVLTDASIDNTGTMHIKSDSVDNFDSVLDQLFEDGIIYYEYVDSEGKPVNKEDLVEGEDYSVKLVIKDETKFNEYFDTSDVEEELNDTYDITYDPDKQGEDMDTILMVSSICLGVEVILFIILLVTLIKKKKALAEEEDEDDD